MVGSDYRKVTVNDLPQGQFILKEVNINKLVYKEPKYLYVGPKPDICGKWEIIQSSRIGMTFLLKNEKGKALIVGRKCLEEEFKPIDQTYRRR